MPSEPAQTYTTTDMVLLLRHRIEVMERLATLAAMQIAAGKPLADSMKTLREIKDHVGHAVIEWQVLDARMSTGADIPGPWQAMRF